MASSEAPEVSPEQRETSTERPKESLAGQQMVSLTEAASEQDAESDRGSQSGDSSDSETASDNSRCVKVLAAAALARISYEFVQSSIMKTSLWSLESHARYFLKG
jgi:hypothetical protein